MTEKTGFRREYRIRRPLPERESVEVTFPFDIVERESRKLGLSVDQFIEQYNVIAEYDGVDTGVIYTFAKR